MRVGNLSLLYRIFLTEASNLGLLHYRQILYQLSYQGNPFPLSGNLLNLVVEPAFPMSPVLVSRFFIIEPSEKPPIYKIL